MITHDRTGIDEVAAGWVALSFQLDPHVVIWGNGGQGMWRVPRGAGAKPMPQHAAAASIPVPHTALLPRPWEPVPGAGWLGCSQGT